MLLFALLLAAASSVALTRLSLDVDLTSMLPRGRAQFADYQRYLERFGAQDQAIALVRAPDAASGARFADALEEALRRRPEILAVRSRVDLAALGRALGDGALARLLPLDAYPELERRMAPQAIAAAVRALRRILAAPGSVGASELLAADPLGLWRVLADALAAQRPDGALLAGSERLLSSDGTRHLLLVRPARSGGFDALAAERLGAALDAAEREARAAAGVPLGSAGIEVAWTGAFAYALEDSRLLRTDMSLYSVAALLGVLAVFFAGYRDLRILPFVTAELLLSSLVAFALGLLIYGRLNAVSLGFAAIFYGLSIDAAIHFYTRVLEERGGSRDLAAALAAATGALVRPTVIASLTTAAMFVVVGFSALAGVAQLGFLTAIGMLLNLPATFVLLPALLLWRERGGDGSGHDRPLPPTARLAALAGFAQRHRAPVLAAAVAVMVLAGVLALRTRLDADLFHLRPSRSAAAAVQAEIERSFGVSDPAGAVVIETEPPAGATPQVRARLEESALVLDEQVAARLQGFAAQGLARSVVGAAALLPSRASQEARLRAWAALPREAAAGELARRLDEGGFAAAPFAGALAALRAVPQPTDATLAPLPGLEAIFEHHLRRSATGLSLLVQFAPRDAAALEEIAERLPREVAVPAGLRLTVTGRPLMERELERTMHREIVWFLLLAVASNAALLWLHERRAWTAAVQLALPCGVLVVLLGVRELVGLPLDPVNLIVLPLTIGMGVDYCLYVVERFRETGSATQAIARTGRALAVTAGTTVVGFGALSLSRYPALSGLGALAAWAMGLCFAATITVLPALLSPAWLERPDRRSPHGGAPAAALPDGSTARAAP